MNRPPYLMRGLFAAFVLAHAHASAALIDFEGLGPEGSITSVPSVSYLTFGNAVLVQPGNPRFAFNGSSSGGPGGIDDANSGNTLSAPDGSGSVLSLSFGTPVEHLGFDAVDIEGAQFLIAQIFDAPTGGNLLGTITLNGGDPGTGDGLLTPLSFSGATNIRRLEIHGDDTGTATAGYAVDNFMFDAVPEPGTSLWGVALAFVAATRRVRARRSWEAA